MTSASSKWSLGLLLSIICAASALSTGCSRNEVVADLNVADTLRKKIGGDGEKKEKKRILLVAQGFADIRGTIIVKGAPPKLSPLKATGEVCLPNGQAMPNEAIVVGPDGGFANVLMYLNQKIPLDDNVDSRILRGNSKR